MWNFFLLVFFYNCRRIESLPCLKETVMPREIPRDLDNTQFKVKVGNLNFGIPTRIKNFPL